MICPACQSANEADARFCEQCGHPLEISCPACGSVTKAGARFCRRCPRSSWRGWRKEGRSAVSLWGLLTIRRFVLTSFEGRGFVAARKPAVLVLSRM